MPTDAGHHSAFAATSTKWGVATNGVLHGGGRMSNFSNGSRNAVRFAACRCTPGRLLTVAFYPVVRVSGLARGDGAVDVWELFLLVVRRNGRYPEEGSTRVHFRAPSAGILNRIIWAARC